MIRHSLSLMLLGAVLVLAGCGGGGSSSSATTYDLNAFETKYVQSSHSYSLSASSQGSTYKLQLDAAPPSSPPTAPIAVCKGNGVIVVNSSITQNGSVVDGGTYERFYKLNPYKVLCDYDPTGGFVTIYADQDTLPTSATVGDSGSLDSAITYYDTGLASVANTGTDAWALESGSNGGADMCLDGVTKTGGSESSELDCFTINPAGNTSALTITFVSGGTTLNFH